MVPHIKIEETLRSIVENPDDKDPEITVAVTAVPDEKKGERIVVLHKPLSKPVEDVAKALSESDLPNLWVPSRDSFVEVDSIPVLGTGKLDLKAIQQTAAEHFASVIDS